MTELIRKDDLEKQYEKWLDLDPTDERRRRINEKILKMYNHGCHYAEVDMGEWADVDIESMIQELELAGWKILRYGPITRIILTNTTHPLIDEGQWMVDLNRKEE